MAMLSEEAEPDWEWIPGPVLDLILHKLSQLPDFLRFAAVCKRWRAAALENVRPRIKANHQHRLPMLMFPTADNSPDRRSLYSITSKTIYNFQIPIPFNNRRCCGCSHGWLASPMDDLSIILFNPFIKGNNNQIRLPRIKKFSEETDYNPQFFIQKVILSKDPSCCPKDYEAVAIYSDMCRLAIIRPGRKQKTWSIVRTRPCFIAEDMTYYNGELYATTVWGRVACFDPNTANANGKRRTIREAKRMSIKLETCAQAAYLVESSSSPGQLFLVRRFFVCGSERPELTDQVEVHKVKVPDRDDDRGRDTRSMANIKLERVESIGEDAFFLGTNQSISVRASDVPGCCPDSVYYTDDCCLYVGPEMGPYERRDFRRYSLKDGRFEPYYEPNPKHKIDMPPPIWITPTLLGGYEI